MPDGGTATTPRERRIIRVREGDPLPAGFWISAVLGHEDRLVGPTTNTERWWLVEVSTEDAESAAVDE